MIIEGDVKGVSCKNNLDRSITKYIANSGSYTGGMLGLPPPYENMNLHLEKLIYSINYGHFQCSTFLSFTASNS